MSEIKELKQNNITTKNFWQDYWKNFVPKPVKKVFFEDLLDNFPENGDLIEIGGFPGKFAAYFVKNKNYKVTILDYIIIPNVIKNVEKINSIPKNSIKTIEADFISYKSEIQYDIVTSFGFIEHFKDTFMIIRKHYDLLKPGGLLFITVPNFRGINGYMQKIYDPINYYKHNIEIMDLKYLNMVCQKLGLKNIEIFYFGKPSIWFEKSAKISQRRRQYIRNVNKFLKIFYPIKNGFFSPWISIKCYK